MNFVQKKENLVPTSRRYLSATSAPVGKTTPSRSVFPTALNSPNHTTTISTCAFLKDLTLRDACFRCPFKYPDGSHADITIGDFWGISQLTPQIDNDFGTTIVIARTPVGEAAASPIEAMATPSYTDIVRYNPAIAYSPAKPPQRDRFVADDRSSDSLTKTMHRYAARSLRETTYLTLARFKRIILKPIKR